MTKIYACLLGEWVCLSDDPECKISEWHKSPNDWWKEGAPVWSPKSKDEDEEHTYYTMDYTHIFYKGVDYRINPIFIQVITE